MPLILANRLEQRGLRCPTIGPKSDVDAAAHVVAFRDGNLETCFWNTVRKLQRMSFIMQP
jgi:hypothetical protein